MTITLPFLFIILHFSHIGLTDALTFIKNSLKREIMIKLKEKKNQLCLTAKICFLLYYKVIKVLDITLCPVVLF